MLKPGEKVAIYYPGVVGEVLEKHLEGVVVGSTVTVEIGGRTTMDFVNGQSGAYELYKNKEEITKRKELQRKIRTITEHLGTTPIDSRLEGMIDAMYKAVYTDVPLMTIAKKEQKKK